ncbi:hypothetical protein MASR1M36_13840 [Candidatus Cloacimonadaceae bacterium]
MNSIYEDLERYICGEVDNNGVACALWGNMQQYGIEFHWESIREYRYFIGKHKKGLGLMV